MGNLGNQGEVPSRAEEGTQGKAQSCETGWLGIGSFGRGISWPGSLDAEWWAGFQ